MRRPFYLLLVFALTCFTTASVAEASGFGRRDSSETREERRSERRSERRTKEKRDSRVRRVEERSSKSKNRGFGRRDPDRRRDERVVIVRPPRHRDPHRHHHHHHPRTHWGWWAAPSAYYVGWGVYPYGYYAYGYHPYWGAPRAEEVDEYEDEQAEEAAPKRQEAPRSSSFSLFGGAQFNQVAPSLVGDLQIDGKRFGFNLRGSTLGSPDRFGDIDLMPMGSAHLTYSFVSTPHMRLRVQGGVSAINAPDFAYVGPDLGASGQIALFGPLALYGRASWTPLPATIIDAEGGVGLHFGGLGVRAGWKHISLSDTWINPDGGTATFSGPTIQAGLVF